MTDIVDRLRRRSQGKQLGDDPLAKVLGEAADEIERLRAALREIEDSSNDPRAVREARAALGGKAMTDIVERLRGYNPPDRTIDEQRQIAVDIYEAAGEIDRLRATHAPSDGLIDALAECIVARQGLPNRDRAKAVLATIEAQGWRLLPPTEEA